MAISKNLLLRRAEHLFLVPYFLMLSTAFYFLFSSSLDVTGLTRANESFVYFTLWIALYFFLLMFFLLDLPSVPRGLWVPQLLTIATVLTYIVFGVQTSSIIKFVTLIFTLMFGCWAASRIETEKFFNYFFNVSIVVAAIHLALFPSLFSLSLHFDSLQRINIFGTTAYAGLFAHKNHAGTFFALAMVVGVSRACSEGGRFTPTITIGLLLQFIGLGLSGAVGPLIAMTVSLMVLLIFTVYARNAVAGMALALTTMIVLLLFLGFQDVLLNSLNRDATYTGRSYLYEVFWHYFSASPWVGYGYGEAFNGTSESVGERVNAATGTRWAHYINFESGILQCLIDFGLVGFILYALMIWRAGRYAWRSMGSARSKQFGPLALLVYIIVSSVNEVFIVLANTLPLVFLVFLFAKDAPLVRRRTVQRHIGVVAPPLAQRH